MIRILPSFVAGQREDLLANGNAHFTLGGQHELLLSYPAGHYPSAQTSDSQMLITRGFSDHYLYDFKSGEMLQNPSAKLVHCYLSAKWVVEEEYWPAKTIVLERGSGLRLEVEGKYSHVIADEDDIVILGHRKGVAAFSKSRGELVWEAARDGQRYPKVVNGCIIYFNKNTENWTTRLVFRDIETGQVCRETTLNYCGHISSFIGNRLILLGWRNGKEGPLTAFVHYHLESGETKEVPVVGDPSYLDIYRDDIAVCCRKENQVDVWKSGGEGKSFIGAIDIDTGEIISQIELPNICFPQSPNFALHDGTYFASGIARTPWPASYWQMVLWDKEDFFNPSPEVYEEPLMGSWEKVMEGEQSFYRVYIDQPCESFFQLHRQMSVALHQCGAIHGLHKNSEGKDRDAAFNGRLVCDVSMHLLNNQERLAIKNLCDFIALELAEGGFLSSYDPADKITIEPSF